MHRDNLHLISDLSKNGVGFHIAVHLLLQLGVHLVGDGHHVEQQFAIFDEVRIFVQGGEKTNL